MKQAAVTLLTIFLIQTSYAQNSCPDADAVLTQSSLPFKTKSGGNSSDCADFENVAEKSCRGGWGTGRMTCKYHSLDEGTRLKILKKIDCDERGISFLVVEAYDYSEDRARCTFEGIKIVDASHALMLK